MNYFELFDLPVSLLPPKEAVRKKYVELSRRYHPDYFAQAAGGEQATALEVSADINKAFKTFGSKEATLKYVLTLKGLLEEEEKYALPPEFLMEMMEMNEKVADVGPGTEPADRAAIDQQLAELEKEMYEPVANIIENYQEGVTTQKELLQVKDYYFKKKYVARIHEALNGML